MKKYFILLFVLALCTWVYADDPFAPGGSGVGTALTAINGENIQDDTIDADSLDWSAFTDLGDGGAVTWGNLTEGELPDSSIVTADIKDGEIVEADLNVSNSPTDDYVLTYNAAGSNFTWVELTAGGDVTSVGDCATGDCTADAVLDDEDISPTGGTWDLSEVDITFDDTWTLTYIESTLTLSDESYIAFDATADGMDDDEYNGEVVTGRNCGENLTQWDLVELVDDADPWHKADATAASGEYPAFGLSVAACTDGNPAIILVKGVVRNEGWTGLTVAGPVYLGETDGALTQTAPSTSNDCVQIVGWALSDSEIYFDFSRPYQLVE